MRSLPLTGRFRENLSPFFDNCIAEAVGYLHCQICSRGPMCEIAATWQTRPSIPDTLRIPLIDLPITSRSAALSRRPDPVWQRTNRSRKCSRETAEQDVEGVQPITRQPLVSTGRVSSSSLRRVAVSRFIESRSLFRRSRAYEGDYNSSPQGIAAHFGVKSPRRSSMTQADEAWQTIEPRARFRRNVGNAI